MTERQSFILFLPVDRVIAVNRGNAGLCGGRADQHGCRSDAPYTSGGKTGTAQVFSLKSGQKYVSGQLKERLRDHSWYIAFAPAENPRIVLAVMVENGGFGAQSAAPIARQVFDYYLTGKKPGGPAPEAEVDETEEQLVEGTPDEAH